MIYAQIPRSVLTDKSLTLTDLRVYGLMACHRNEKTHLSYPGAKSLAATLGHNDPKTVKRSINKLEAAGYLVRRGFSDRRTKRFYLPQEGELLALGGQSTPPEPDLADQTPEGGPGNPLEGGQLDPSRGAGEPTKQTTKQIDNNNSEIPTEIQNVGNEVLAIIGVPVEQRSAWNLSTVCKWIAEGADPDGVIYPTVRTVKARAKGPINSLKFFDKEISKATAEWKTTGAAVQVELEDAIDMEKARTKRKESMARTRVAHALKQCAEYPTFDEAAWLRQIAEETDMELERINEIADEIRKEKAA